jgi:hypothetical protein
VDPHRNVSTSLTVGEIRSSHQASRACTHLPTVAAATMCWWPVPDGKSGGRGQKWVGVERAIMQDGS